MVLDRALFPRESSHDHGAQLVLVQDRMSRSSFPPLVTDVTTLNRLA